jgi:hypothetical protein
VDGYSYGASDGEPAAHARYYFEIILLDLHARAATMTMPSASQLVRDVPLRDGHPGGQALEYGDKCPTMGFSGREISKSIHGPTVDGQDAADNDGPPQVWLGTLFGDV